MRAELKDFSGGITDFIFTDDITCCETLDNFVITKDKAPVVRWGSEVVAGMDDLPAVDVETPANIIEFRDDKVIVYGGEILVWDGSAWTKVQGPGSGVALSRGDNTSRVSWFEWNKHLVITDNKGSKQVKLFKDNAGAYQVRTAGLPALATTPTVTPVTPSTKSHIYYFIYSYTYQAGDVTHRDYGPVTQLQITNGADLTTSQNNITGIPSITNDPHSHYDTSNIKVRIYRTIDGAEEGYFIGEVANGVTTFADNITDADALLGELIYTDGGVSDNDPPPVCDIVDISNSVAWHVKLKDAPYKARQSQLNDPDSVPQSYEIEFEEELTGWSSFQSNPVAFTENAMFRIEGVVNLDGSGEHRKVQIADGVTSVSQNGIVKTKDGIYFCGKDSFYWTDGYTVEKIPGDEKNIPVRYAALAGFPDAIRSSYDRVNNRVMWVTKSSAIKYTIYVYDVAFNALTTWSGVGDSFKPTGILCSKDGEIYRTDLSGYVFTHKPQRYSDPVIDVDLPTSEWQSHPVIFDFKHVAFDFGATDLHKWCTRLTVSGEGKTSLNVAINTYDDSADDAKSLTPLEHTSGLIWADPAWVYGSNEDLWQLEKRLNLTRFFRSGKLRCKRKQIQFTNAIATIAESVPTSTDSHAVVDSVAKTITPINPAAVYIPPNAKGLDISIGDYVYKIGSSSATSFTVLDPQNTLTDGTVEWAIIGYPDNQRFHLSSFIYTYDMLNDQGGRFQRGVAINAT